MSRTLSIQTAVLVALASAPALGQTVPNINANNLLQPFSGLDSTVLTPNLNTTISINNGATAAQRTQAVTDTLITTDTGAVVADGLGSRLNGIYQSAISGNAAVLAASGNIVQAFRQANGISQADSGFNKYYFANGMRIHPPKLVPITTWRTTCHP